MDDILTLGKTWASATTAPPVQESRYCSSRDIFQARLDALVTRLEKKIGEPAYLITAVAGELGNNSFDHNLGSWPDVPGVFFSNDEQKDVVVLVDRGQGIKKTISRVLPDIADDETALFVAFTKTVSGRAPENRGNGLKFVARVITQERWSLTFISGKAQLLLMPGHDIVVNPSTETIPGCFAVIQY